MLEYIRQGYNPKTLYLNDMATNLGDQFPEIVASLPIASHVQLNR